MTYLRLSSPLRHVCGICADVCAVIFCIAFGALVYVNGGLGQLFLPSHLGAVATANEVAPAYVLVPALFAFMAFHTVAGGGQIAAPVLSSLMTDTRWRVICAASRLMPPAAGSRWLAEARSFLAEVPLEYRRRAIRSYLVTAPRVIAVTWAISLRRVVR